MTKREKVLAVSGVIILAVGLAGRGFLLRATRVDWPESPTWFTNSVGSSDGRPLVLLGYDDDDYRLSRSVRIDVRHGIPHARVGDGMPIGDIVSYINAESSKTGADYVIVSISAEEKTGSVISILDECRKARVKAVILNSRLDAFADK